MVVVVLEFEKLEVVVVVLDVVEDASMIFVRNIGSLVVAVFGSIDS